jgi:hypothetical protein
VRSPLTLALLPALVLGMAFYVWTAATSADLDPGAYGDAYNRQVDAFAHGQLHLLTRPDPRLVALPDPFDTAVNYRFIAPDVRDMVLHDGRLYTYWGAAPAVVAFWPFRALGLGDLPPGLAVLLFALLALTAQLLLLRLLLERYVPNAPPTVVAVAGIVVPFGNMLPWLLRRPEAYEVAISAGQCFLWAGLVLIALPLVGRRPRPWALALAGLCFGLAFASRPPIGIGILLGAGALALLMRSGGLARGRAVLRAGVFVAAPFVACVAAVCAYNALRFGSPANFGVLEQLTSERAERFNSFAYVPAGLWNYVLFPPKPSAAFPFLWTDVPRVPFPKPGNYQGSEATAGLLTVVPYVLVLGLGPLALRRTRTELRAIVLGLTGAATVLLVFTAFYYWGALMRYEADFLGLYVLAAGLTLCAFAAERLPRRRRRAGIAVASLLAAMSILAVAAISLIGSDDRLRQRHLGTFRALERFFSPVPSIMAQLAGHPILSSVGGTALAGTPRYDTLGVRSAGFFLGTGPYPLQIAAGGRTRAVLHARLRRLPSTPAGVPLVVEARSPDGSVTTVPVTGATATLRFTVRSGVNDVTLQLIAPATAAIPPYADSPDDGAIRVDGLRLVD